MAMFAVAVLMSFVAFADVYLNTHIRTSGAPGTGNEFYGYNGGSGPGDDSFAACVNIATNDNVILMVIYGKNGCSTCSSFAKSINEDSGRSFAIGGSINAYFRGGSSACDDAFDFFKTHLGGATGSCHLLGFYGYAPNGTAYTYSGTLPTTYSKFQNVYSTQTAKCRSHIINNQITATARFKCGKTTGSRLEATEQTRSVYVPIYRASRTDLAETDRLIVEYPDGTAATNILEWAAGGATSTNVPVSVAGKWAEKASARLTLTDTVKGGTLDSAAIYFVDGDNAFSFPDMEFDENGEWGQWTLYSEDSWNAATQKVYAANTYSQPDTNDNARVENIVMDFPVSPSNRYEVVYTNDITFFADSMETVDIKHQFNFIVTNLATTVYTNDLAAFESAKDDEEIEFTAIFPGALQVVTNYVEDLEGVNPYDVPESVTTNIVTITNSVFGVASAQGENPVEWTWARSWEDIPVECFTNRVEYALTNEVYAAGAATTNSVNLVLSAPGKKSYYLNQKLAKGTAEIPVSESFASNCVYAVTPQADLSALTNLYSSVGAAFSGVVEVDNEITILPCDNDHAVPSSETVAKAEDPQPVVQDFEVAGVATYYTVQSNWQETAEQEFTVYGTNRTFYVLLPGCETNEDATAQTIIGKTEVFAMTNFYFVALTNAENTEASCEVTWTNLEAVIAVDCTNLYYSVATNEYQYGVAGRAVGGRSEKDIQSFILKVTGGAVWNAKTVAFAKSVFDSDAFADWCASNNVVTLLEECADPETGASLFSYEADANGRSGSAFLSRKGLDASQCEQPPASNVFEVALFRPDGTLAGILEPQMDEKGVCDTDENIARLKELVVIANDLTEPENNDVASTALEAHYGTPTAEVDFQTLSVSDKKDVFKLHDIPANEFVSITAVSLPESHYDGEKPKVSVWRHGTGGKQPAQIAAMGGDHNGNPVWRFAASDVAAGLFAEVTAWTAGNSESLRICSGGSGSGSMFLYPLVVQAAEEFPGVVSFASPSNQMYDVDAEIEIELKVARTGYTGAAAATVTLTECQLPATSYSWVNANNATNITWQEGESGEKSFFVKVKNVLWEDSVSNLVFTITEASGAQLDGGKASVTIGIQQEDDENALTGQISISSPTVAANQTLWLEGGITTNITVVRERVLNEKNDKWEARGEAFAAIAATGGAQLTTNRLEWLKGARVGEREFQVRMPDVGKSGEQSVTLTVSGFDADGKPLTNSVSTIKFMVIPAGAPKFLNNIDAEAYQYVPFDESQGRALLDYNDEDLEIVGYESLSGSLPAGLVASTDEYGLKISGVPTGTNSTEATYQVTLRRKKGENAGYLVKTMPVSVKISSKALGGTPGAGGADNAVIPAFADRRVWQYLPMTNGEGRLTGLLNLSAAPKGSLSARYTTPKRTVQFLAPTLDGVVTNEASGGYRAYAKMEKAGCSLEASFTTDSRAFATFAGLEDGDAAAFESEPGSKPWLCTTNGASAWKGCYTVVLGQTGDAADANVGGVAAVSLRMSSPAMVKTGRVTYNGVLPNGHPLNGTTAFLPPVAGAAAVKVPILWNSAADSLSAILVVTNTGSAIALAADPAVTPFWTTGGGAGAGDLAATGGGLFASEDVATAWKRDFGTGKLVFKYDGNAGSATVAPDGKGVKIDTAGSVDEDGFALESIVLNRVSGVVTGTVLVRFGAQRLSVPFRGAVLSGNKECFMKGTAWYTAVEGDLPVRKSVTVEMVPADPQ